VVKAAGRAFVSPISAFPSGMRRGEGPARRLFEVAK
jgi:hypothetical protein